MAASEQPRIFFVPGLDPDSSTPRSSCQHSPAVLANAMRTLTERHRLPDFTTKSGLKDCYENMDRIIPALILSADASARDVHLAAAAHIHLSMVAADALLGEELNTYPELNDTIADALRSPCDLRILAGLRLVLKLLPNAGFDCLEELKSAIIPLVQNHIVATKVEDLVLELSLDVWTEWAVFLHVHDTESGYLLINFMERLAMASRHTNRRQIASHILRRLQHVTCSTGVFVSEDAEEAEGMQKFFIAALRYDSAGDRLTAMRAFCHSFDRHSDDDSPEERQLYPVAPLTAAEYTRLIGRTQSHGLDTTRSDAKGLLDLRAEFFNCMRGFCWSHDAHALAGSLHGLLLRDPRVVDFSSKSVEQFAGGRAPAHYQLAFTSWRETLQHCAEALKACSRTGCGDHRQEAHILELQSYILGRKAHIAAQIASRLVEASDVSALWYLYALGHDASRGSFPDAVRAVKDLITSQSPITTRPLYECTIATMAISAWSYVLTGSLEARLIDHWDTLAGRGALAAWTASEYLRLAPFDGQYVTVMNEILLMYNIWKSPPTSLTDPSPDKSFLSRDRWRIATAVHSRVWSRPIVPHFHAMVKMIWDDYQHAVDMYSPILDSHLSTTAPPSPTDSSDALIRGDIYSGARRFSPAQITAWRALISGQDSTSRHRARAVCWRDAPRQLLAEVMQANYRLRMHSCANCGVESVVLRRCSACKAIRYCTRDCQAEDWREDHKYSCPRTYA